MESHRRTEVRPRRGDRRMEARLREALQGSTPAEGVAGSEPAPQGAPGTVVVAASGSEGTATAAPAVGTEEAPAVAPAVGKAPGETGEGSVDPEGSGEAAQAEAARALRDGHRGAGERPRSEKAGGYAVRAGPAAGLKKDMELKVVGPELEGGKRKLLGYATVDAVKPGRADAAP